MFERARAVRPGAVSRPEAWWPDEQFEATLGTRFDVVYESPSGTLDGFLAYGIKPKWATDGPEFELTVRDLVGVTAEATAALWRFACEVDLVRTITCGHAPLDLALPWMLESARAVRVRAVTDFLWTRVLDVVAALGARTYASPGEVVLEVRDSLRPDGDAAGVFLVAGGPDGAAVARTDRTPDLALDAADLSAAWLGGVRFATLAPRRPDRGAGRGRPRPRRRDVRVRPAPRRDDLVLTPPGPIRCRSNPKSRPAPCRTGPRASGSSRS